METRFIAKGGAIVLAGIAIAASALALRDEPRAPDPGAVTKPAPVDRLEILLRECEGIGEAAAADPDCRAAWAEKRQRFLGLASNNSGGQ